jgi:hypothetical protein
MLRSPKIIPPFDPFAPKVNCVDNDGNGSVIDITSDYHKGITKADYLLYVGIVDLPEAPFLAYASFCVMGRLF